jgi:hypothetical protein
MKKRPWIPKELYTREQYSERQEAMRLTELSIKKAKQEATDVSADP